MAAARNSTLNRAANTAERVGGASGGGSSAAAGPGGGRQAVIQAFLPLRQFVGAPEGGGAMDGVLASFTQVANTLNGIAVLGGGDGSTGAQQSMDARAAILQLRQNGNSLPLPVSGWALGMAGDAESALGMARGAQMGAAMDANFANCTQTMATAFPIQTASTADLPIESFTQIFGPGGTFASFVNTQLNNYIDTSQPEWQMKANGGEVGLTPGSVRAFQAANRVTRTFFAGDPNAPRLSYQIEPVALSGAESVVVEIDGQRLSYDGQTPIPVTFDWPGAGGATLQFRKEGSSPTSPRAFSGPWALFRLMKLAAVRSGPSPTIGVGSLTHSGARFDFRIRTFGANNPFVSDPFVQVACPEIDASALARAGLPVSHHG
jgi:type VI secretion system protein ImpL